MRLIFIHNPFKEKVRLISRTDKLKTKKYKVNIFDHLIQYIYFYSLITVSIYQSKLSINLFKTIRIYFFVYSYVLK